VRTSHDEVKIQLGTPSPVPRRLAKTPSRATLSPKGERAKFSHKLPWGEGKDPVFLAFTH
jgi:hypothetical protein